MLNRLILKFFNIPTALRIKSSPFLNRWKMSLMKIQYGNHCTILGRIHIIGEGKISIGDNFCMTSGLGINAVSGNLEGAFHVEKDAQLIIGNNVGMNSTRIRVKTGVQIGNHVKFGANVLVIDTDSHPIDYINRRSTNKGAKSLPINIEDDVWIGANCTILKGVTIGARSIIGAGSVVTKDIPADCIAAGNPCNVIKVIQ